MNSAGNPECVYVRQRSFNEHCFKEWQVRWIFSVFFRGMSYTALKKFKPYSSFLHIDVIFPNTSYWFTSFGFLFFINMWQICVFFGTFLENSPRFGDCLLSFIQSFQGFPHGSDQAEAFSCLMFPAWLPASQTVREVSRLCLPGRGINLLTVLGLLISWHHPLMLKKGAQIAKRGKIPVQKKSLIPFTPPSLQLVWGDTRVFLAQQKDKNIGCKNCLTSPCSGGRSEGVLTTSAGSIWCGGE